MGDGRKGGLDDTQKQLYPLWSTEHRSGVRGRRYSTEETQRGPRVMLYRGHCEIDGLVLLVCRQKTKEM